MTSRLSSLLKTFSDFKGTILNTSIAGGTVAIEEIINRAVYYCPCVEPSELGQCNSTANSMGSKYQCTLKLNAIYGIVFIAVPALALFLLSIAANPNLWKICTGRLVRSREIRARRDRIFKTVIGVFARSMIAPITWVCYALLDGKYYACSITPLPYHIDGIKYKTCQDVARSVKPYYSDAYRDNSSFSQMIGWIVLGATGFIGILAYTASRCSYPLTYYHAKYYDLYRMHEENEFDDEMNKKAQQHAEDNVKKFMSQHRQKNLWDRISTVYEFHRNCDQIALYSYLHEFILDEDKKNSELTSLVDTNGGGNNEAERENEAIATTTRL